MHIFSSSNVHIQFRVPDPNAPIRLYQQMEMIRHQTVCMQCTSILRLCTFHDCQKGLIISFVFIYRTSTDSPLHYMVDRTRIPFSLFSCYDLLLLPPILILAFVCLYGLFVSKKKELSLESLPLLFLLFHQAFHVTQQSPLGTFIKVLITLHQLSQFCSLINDIRHAFSASYSRVFCSR